ncbi:MAG TPA: discoidin domain-containing protein [Actinophytocola sp.]|uniref:discoidin domain-containing protein n=1 Tax=Actinophytocola sp. TaxID=1872138 RepID=UPI002DDDA93B|nr:discoidin domain-containing protein [Actinophytocola sp.]HEV2784350.1 discoidin domain-containing protein [Actinophytocola sp.]
MRGSCRARLRAGLAALAVAAGSLIALSPVPAQAELQHPRQDFLRNAQAGLFIHWGMRTSPQHTSCSGWENDVTNGGWNANYWVNEAKKLHAQYIVLATFHSRLGYARPWPSAIPGSCRTNRDFLQELINATNSQGLKTILYMTDDPQWFNEGLPSGQSWLNSSAYSNFKGHSVDLHTRDGFGEFSYDLFVEVMQRYDENELAGFWIDNDNAYWERNGLYERVRQMRPTWTLSNNNEDTPIMDMISNEQKTGMSPSYDYPQAVYTAAPRLIEADYKLPSSGAWWYDGSNPSVDQRLTLGRYITNAGSSIKSLMAETAQVNGRFPSNQESFNNFANTYLNAIWGSINGTEGGGYMFGGLKPGFWNDGAHGVTTISKTNPDLHFIHVITRPSGSTLRLRDNGYRVTGVTNFRTGTPVSFTQSGGNLTLTGVSSWDQFDTVFRVTTAGRQGIIPPSTYTMSSSASASGHGAAAAADGSYLTYWDSNKTLPVSLRFDLGSTKRVQYIGINQREDSVAYARSDTEQSARIRDYRVYVSGDGSNWGSPIATGTLPSRRGVAVIDLPVRNTRHVRLEVVNTHAASSDSTRFQRLRIDEAWIASDYAGGGGPAPTVFEAENGLCEGTIDSNHTGFTGTGFCNLTNAVGSVAEWTVPATTAGSTAVTLRFANGTTANRPMDITVNGALVSDELAFDPTGAWTNWGTATITVPLNAGDNTIRATSTVATGGPNLDHLAVG